MNQSDKQDIDVVFETNGEVFVTDLYPIIEQLSLPEKAALAQHLISTNELKVVVSSRATVGDAIQAMDRIQLGHTLESIAEQVRRLHQHR